MPECSLTIVLPAYNEEARLGPALDELFGYLHRRGVRVAAACSGTFLLASTGLLDARRATTSWWLAHAFARAFPRVNLEADAMVIDEGSVLTTGGATAVLNLILDFDYVERGVEMGAPARESWRAAFGLTVTMVWLYIELLRLISYIRR